MAALFPAGKKMNKTKIEIMKPPADIQFTKLAFHLRAETPIHLPPFPGSVFRGGFGKALRQICCAMGRQQACEDCLLVSSCIYALVFETSTRHVSESTYKLQDYPRPFVIEPPYPVEREIRKSQSFICHLILFGPSIELLPYFILAFTRMGRSGLGRSRGKFRIDQVNTTAEFDNKVVFDGRSDQFVAMKEYRSLFSFCDKKETLDQIELNFITPTRIKFNNHLTKALTFELLMINVLRRITILFNIATGEKWEFDYQYLIQQATMIQCHAVSLHWLDWKRYSSRQKNAMQLDGFIGKMSFMGKLALFLPFLRMGEYLHVGKQSTFGLGKYEITPGLTGSSVCKKQ